MAIVKHESAPREVEMNPATMIQAIVDKGITAESVGVMKDLIAMQREMKAEAAKASFAKAFADVRRECGKILATKTIPTKDGGVKGRFASLSEIQDQIEPLLERHGFFMTFDQERLEGGLTRVVCVVVHNDGHEMRSGFTCREHQSPQNSPAQNDGGTNTLAKRYAMCNMFGIRIDYEADAGADGGTITPQQAEELRARAGRVYGGDADRMNRLLKFAGASTWAAITEADMRDYAAMYLVNPSGSWTGHWFESRLSPDPGEPEIAVTGTLPHHSPWRIIMAADDPGRLVESNVVTSSNPPQAIQDTSWIRAGKAAWDWWSGSLNAEGKRAFTTENMKYYVDFAARSGLEYMLVDAGWSARGDITAMNGTIDVPELVRYGAAKNVKIWIWLHYAQLDRQMDEAFPLYEKWGVAGVKIDFLSRDDQQMTRFYYRTARKAAEHHLMVDIHGSTKPTGMNRTWPNVVGYEAVLGMEQSKAGARDNPEHHVTLPFTRMLVGQMDYTPGAFENSTREDFVPRMLNPMVMGTRAHQLAMYAVYEAAIQMVADHPGAYRDQPAFEFIRAAPATWDETRVLNGRPGEFITVARRNGNEWFLGSMTNWSARKLDVPLSFLGAGQYRAEIYADARDADRSPKNVSIQRKTVDRTARLPIEMAPGGGCAVRFVPVNR